MEEIEVEGPTKPVTDHSADTRSPVARHSFYIQDILSPEFGNKQLTDQYYAYLRYCYSLHIQNVMLLHNQQHLQMLSKRAERQEHKQMGSSPDDVECFSNVHRNRVSNRVVRPTPRSDLKMRPVMVEGQGKRGLDSFLQSPTRGQSNTTVVTSSRTCSNDALKDSSCNVKGSYGVEPISPASCSTDKPDGGIQRSPPVKSRHGSSGGDKQSNRDNSKVAAESVGSKKESAKRSGGEGDSSLWPAWVYCTRYSDRPSSGKGPRSRKIKRKSSTPTGESSPSSSSEKRPRIAFTNEQLGRLKREFEENRYLTEDRRAKLASQLELTESQVKIWFQNKRAKLKKSTGTRNPLAIQLMQQGLYNHATVPTDQDGMDDEEIQAD